LPSAYIKGISNDSCRTGERIGKSNKYINELDKGHVRLRNDIAVKNNTLKTTLDFLCLPI
jgi:hypothetical protein